MKINELMTLVGDHYDDRETDRFWDPDKQCPKYSETGDGLAQFIVIEIAETFDPKASTDDQLEEALRVMCRARNQLNDLCAGLTEAANKAASGELP